VARRQIEDPIVRIVRIARIAGVAVLALVDGERPPRREHAPDQREPRERQPRAAHRAARERADRRAHGQRISIQLVQRRQVVRHDPLERGQRAVQHLVERGRIGGQGGEPGQIGHVTGVWRQHRDFVARRYFVAGSTAIALRRDVRPRAGASFACRSTGTSLAERLAMHGGCA
jgi:hypothetical protein